MYTQHFLHTQFEKLMFFLILTITNIKERYNNHTFFTYQDIYKWERIRYFQVFLVDIYFNKALYLKLYIEILPIISINWPSEIYNS